MKTAIVSEKISASCKRTLESEGFAVLPCPACTLLPAPISHHPDSLMARAGAHLFTYEGYIQKNAAFFSSLQALCPHLTVHGLAEPYGASYPEDCRYNLLTADKHAFFHPAGLAPSLIRAIGALGYREIRTRQGYAACTVLTLGDRHAITADAGLAGLLSENGVSVLKIENGEILLPPYDYGFIGGASGVYGSTAYFLGDITRHPSYGAMHGFADRAGFSLRSLSSEPLRDLGGIFFLE